MRIFDIKLILEIISEAQPLTTDRKLWDLRKEKIITACNYEIVCKKLHTKSQYDRFTQKIKENKNKLKYKGGLNESKSKR